MGRRLILFLTSFITHNSWIKLLGAAYLIHLAFDNLEDKSGGSEDNEHSNPFGTTHPVWMEKALS